MRVANREYILNATHQRQNLGLCVMYAIALLGFYSAMKEV